MNVKLIRSGEDVIADLIEENDDSVVISNPIVAIPAGNGQMSLEDKDETFLRKYIVYIADTQDQIEEQFFLLVL